MTIYTHYNRNGLPFRFLLLGVILIILITFILLTSCVAYTDADRFRHGVEVYQSQQGGIYEIN